MTTDQLEHLVETYNAAAAVTERLARHIEGMDRADPETLAYVRLHRALAKKVARVAVVLEDSPLVETIP